MSELAELQRAFTRVCFDERPRDEDLARLDADRARWILYRRMVRSRFFAILRTGLPKTAALLDKAAFDRAVARYLAERAPRTRFLREIVHEFVAHALPGWSADPALPAHLADLVRYEDAKWRASSIEWSVDPGEVAEFDFEAVPYLNPTVQAVRAHHRVDKDAAAPPAEGEHVLVVFRRPESNRIQTYALNDVGGRLFAAWASGESGADGARRVLRHLGRAPDARFVDGMAGVLADLIEQKIVLGSRR